MNLKADIESKGPAWAVGCFNCTFGVIVSKTPENLTTLAMTRLVGFLDGSLELCSCKAGQRYKVCLLNMQQRMIEEARANPTMSWCVGSHPEIESARRLLHKE